MNMHLANEYQPHDSEVKFNRGTSQNLQNTHGLHNTQAANLPQNASATVGQVLTGEIIQVTPNTVQLLLQDQSVIQARLEGNVNLSLHSTMSFEVSSSKGHNLLLRPLYLNTANNQTLLKALEAAGLPKNDKTIELVSKQMEANQPIDKNTLQRIYHQISEYPQAKVSDILALRELGLPVNQNNLTQYSTCMNLKETFSNTVMELEGNIMSVVDKLAESENPERLGSFLKEIIKAFSQESVEGQISNSVPDITADGSRAMSAMQQGNVIITDSNINQVLSVEQEMTQKQNVTPENNLENVPQNQDVDSVLKEQGAFNTELEEATEISGDKNSQNDALQNLKMLLNSTETPKPEEIQKNIRQLLEQNLVWEPEKFVDEFKDVLKSFVKQIYAKVMLTAENLARIDITEFPEAESLQKSAQQTQNHVQFLNDLNQSIMYLQIPLKQSGALKDGHLHVYSRNKKLSSSQDEVTALIHLDMDHLGPVSVHVTLWDNRIGTKFYLKDEETILLIEKHIGMLDKRIRDRGYDFHAEMTEMKQDYKPDNVLKNASGMEEDEIKDSCIGQYSFDVRA